MTEFDLELPRLRSEYQRLNRSFDRSFAFRFGGGGGFCAEMLGLVKTMMSCLHGRVRLCMSRGGHPTGTGIVNGFTDYFDPMFPEVRAGIFNALNSPVLRGSGRLPIVRTAVSRVLHVVTGVDRFMMDDLGALPGHLVVPELEIDAEYWDACAMLARLVWVYQPEVAEDIAKMVSDWAIPESYVSVHVRRGDKSRESPYVAADTYSTAIQSARPLGCAVVVASDDGSAMIELAELLPSRYRIIPISVATDRGYRQEEFNRLAATERFRRLKRLLAELEVLGAADVFVGSSGSNVTHLIEVIRAGQGVVQVS